MPEIGYFISSTIHVFVIYTVVALFLVLFPFTGLWARIVGWLDGLVSVGRWYGTSVVIVVGALVHVTVLVIYAFQYDKSVGIDFWTFAWFSFFLMPFSLPFFAVVIPLARQGAAGLGTFLAYLFALGGFGSAATNIHDVIWCGKVTSFYMKERIGGGDLDLWVNLLHTGTYDYRIFGFYMLLQVIVALATAHFILSRLQKLNNIRLSSGFFPIVYLGIASMAFGITILDWPRTFSTHLYNILAVSAGLYLGILFFYAAGHFVKMSIGKDRR